MGLLDVKHFTLEFFANYILGTRKALQNGHPVLTALGVSLPALRVPKDTTYFNGLNERTAGHRSKWKQLYGHVIKRRACYLLKQKPNQSLLTEEELRKSFKKVKEETVPENLHNIIESFISTSSGWNNFAEALANCEWEEIKPVFDGLKREKFNLGGATVEFYDEREEGLLTSNDRDYLERLTKRRTSESQEEDDEFYQNHRIELKEDPQLKAKWDRFVYGKPIETDDFLIGIALSLEGLFDENLINCKKKLTIRCNRRTKGEFRQLNNKAGLFFSFRYKGLRSLFGNKMHWGEVYWDVGKLFDFEELDREWRSARKSFVNRSVAKSALRIKFYLELEVELSNAQTEHYTKQLIWKFNSNAVPAELRSDWKRLCKHPIMQCTANLEPVSSKGHYQFIDLTNAKTLLATYDKDKGSCVSVYKKALDISIQWPEKLDKSFKSSLINTDTYEKLTALFDDFKDSYSFAIKGFWEDGCVNEFIDKQAEEYHLLLETICAQAKGDRSRDLLLRPLLEIGAVKVIGAHVTTIIAPWHPLRLAAIANKARRIASLVKYLLTADQVMFGDVRLFFKELEDELKHPYYPEIVLGWKEKEPKLLSLSDSYLDYSLHEPPIASEDGFDNTNENPLESAVLVLNTVKQFLLLYPHEKANLSIVLYNTDSARLPQAIVDKMSNLQDDEEDMRCQIVLRHRDGRKLRDLYVKIVESIDNDPDSFVASEIAKDFMAKLRIGIMADQTPVLNTPEEGPLTDLVFLQDVIARHAKLEWYSVDAAPLESSKLVPQRWSRRRPLSIGDMKSVVYLCSPVQTIECWSFITAVTSFLKGDWNNNKDERLLPARQLDFNNSETATIFEEIHNMGNWVVNHDELLDRRQLQNQSVRVIKYKQLSTQGRNIVISSTAPLKLLKTMVYKRIKNLNLELTDEACHSLAKRFLDDAMEISGDIVLRAAKRGKNASELMGIVLSRFMIQQELGNENHIGWYFLDDYAEWLGQKEQQIADILALMPYQNADGEMQLSVVICESKYISADSLSSKRRESQKQLRDTVRRINDAIFGDPRRLDRDLWLSRFSDLLLNGTQFTANSDIDLESWRRAIRNGECNVYLRGYSHVFVHGPTDSTECSDFARISELDNSYQEVYSRGRLKQLVMHFEQGTDTTPLRKEVADRDVWGQKEYKQPSEPIVLTQKTTYSEDTATEKKKDSEANSFKQESETTPENNTVSPEHISSNWAYPIIENIINEYQEVHTDSATENEWLKQTENICKGALQQFQLRSKLLSSTLTPNAALLKFQGSANLTVEQVLKRRSEFLTTHGLDLISVRAEPGTVAISITRPNRRILELLDVWKNWKSDCTNGNHTLLIGLKEEDSSQLFFSPKLNAPHTLIAGSTNSGKSVLMQNIILSIAATNTPEQAKIILIDPKSGVDYFAFDDLPHLGEGGIYEQNKAIEQLNQLVKEMDRRYVVLRENKVSNIFELNAKENATEHAPVLWVIHDEFADWMMTDDYKKAVTNVVSRLGIKARAAGIFLIFAAQRPDNNVMPLQLRDNLGNRLILKVNSEGTSEIALGEKGAERLLGKGHLAAKLEGESSVITAQVPFISAKELEKIVNCIK